MTALEKLTAGRIVDLISEIESIVGPICAEAQGVHVYDLTELQRAANGLAGMMRSAREYFPGHGEGIPHRATRDVYSQMMRDAGVYLL